jgi:light-regulated signal transduction histidine kinase (bacteriophytochrome)
VLGRTWELEFAAVPDAFGQVGPAPWLAGLFGVLATLGAAAQLRTVQHREAAARSMADELTADLRAEEQRVIEANRELAHSNDLLADSNEELSRFAFVASHDLQEPLRMVSSFLGLLEGHLQARDELDDEAREYLGFAVDGARRMSRLIQDLLVLSRVQRRVNEPEPTDTADVVDGVLTVLQPRVEESGATVEVRRTDPVVADPTQLLQLVQNLTANALKFTRDEAGDWHLRVADNGIGIDPAHRDQVFEAFTRLHARSEYEGTGIGLAVCQRVARAHGGRIRAEDGIDGGLAVVVDLPGAADRDRS